MKRELCTIKWTTVNSIAHHVKIEVNAGYKKDKSCYAERLTSSVNVLNKVGTMRIRFKKKLLNWYVCLINQQHTNKERRMNTKKLT